MIIKNKILDKILKVYLSIFFLFSVVCVNIVISDIFKYYNIYNIYISYIVFIITICSYIGLGYIIEKDINK